MTKRWLLGPLLLTILVSTGIVCGPDADVTFVNQTNQTVRVYKSEKLNDFLVELPPNSRSTLNLVKDLWEDQVVLRDASDVILSKNRITWDDLEKTGFEFVVSDSMPVKESTPQP